MEGLIGDRAFVENAAAQSAPIGEWLDRRFASVDVYRAAHRARSRRLVWSDEAERLAERWTHYQLAPLPDGSFRQRALRRAVEAEWASIVEADSMGVLARVRCPVLFVQALKPWFGGYPYFSDEIVAAQLRVARAPELFVARNSDHGTLVGEPEPDLIATLRRFAARCAESPVGVPKDRVRAPDTSPRPDP